MYKYTNFSDDRSRVCLKGAPGVDSCDYINASFIDVSINNTSNNLSKIPFITSSRDMEEERMHILQHKVTNTYNVI